MAEDDPDISQWYYLKAGRQFGPVPERSIRAWLESGFLGESDLLWRNGMPEWTAANALSEFGGMASAPLEGPPRVQAEDQAITPNAATTPPSTQERLATPTVVAAPGVRYGGFWLRVGAFIIDNLIVNALVSPLLLMQMKPGESINPWEPDPLVASAFVIVYLLYGALSESSPWQATLGKRAWRIRVTSVNGGRISPTQALVRQIAKVVSALGFGLGFVMAAISPRKQALHDWLSGCVVVKE